MPYLNPKSKMWLRRPFTEKFQRLVNIVSYGLGWASRTVAQHRLAFEKSLTFETQHKREPGLKIADVWLKGFTSGCNKRRVEFLAIDKISTSPATTPSELAH